MTAREVAGLITFPSFAIGRVTTDPRSKFRPSLTGTRNLDGILLGWVRWYRKNLFRIYLESDNLDNWTVIFGDQDTDILETSQVLIQGLYQKKNPIIILDLERLESTPMNLNTIMKPEDQKNPLRLNLLEMNFSEDANEKVEIVTRAFKESLRLSPEQSQILWETFRSIFRQRRTEEMNGRRPAISSIIAEIQRNRDPHRDSPELSMLLKKIVSLAEGKIGSILNQRDSIQVEDLMRGTTLIELGQLRDTGAKRLLASLILASLTQAVKVQVLGEEDCKPFLVLREAGSITEEDAGDQNIIMQTLLELKRRGIGLLVVQTSPRMIPSYLVEQCRTRICHRLVNRRDLDLAQKIFNLDDAQTDLLQELSDKEALVKTPDQIRPFLIWIGDLDLPQAEKIANKPLFEEDVLEILSEVSEDEFGEGSTPDAT